eukprot:gene8423-5903_t
MNYLTNSVFLCCLPYLSSADIKRCPMFHDQALEPAIVHSARKRGARAVVAEYRLQDVVDFLLERETLFEKVALQFPDEMLGDVVEVTRALEDLLIQDKRTAALKKLAGLQMGSGRTDDCTCGTSVPAQPASKRPPGSSLDNPNQPRGEVQLFSLCDNTFGSCCADELTAQHYGAQCIIHFGEACMSNSTSLPTFYIHNLFRFAGIPGPLEATLSPMVVVEAARRLVAVARAVEKQFCAQLLEGSKNEGLHIKLVVIGTHPSRPIVEAARRAAESSLSDDVCWCSFTEIGMAKMTRNAPSTSWTINGVRFPMLSAGSPERNDVQIFLFVGPSGSSHLLHLNGVLQYNQFHYSDAQQQLLDAFNEVAPSISVLHEATIADTEGVQEANTWLLEHSKSLENTPEKVAQEYAEQLMGGNFVDAVSSDPAVLKGQMDYQRRIRQRDYNIEMLRASGAIGILVVSLSIEGYYDVTMQLHKLIRLSQKRSYIIYVGHLNEFKLSNFVDTVDCFVAVACPNSRASHFPQKSDGYMKPVVSPAEVLIALSDDEEKYKVPAAFNTALEYILDPLQRAIHQKEAQAKLGQDNQEDWRESAQLVRAATSLTCAGDGSGALAKLYERSYVGLDPRVGATPVQQNIAQGKEGIARGYKTELYYDDPTAFSLFRVVVVFRVTVTTTAEVIIVLMPITAPSYVAGRIYFLCQRCHFC